MSLSVVGECRQIGRAAGSLVGWMRVNEVESFELGGGWRHLDSVVPHWNVQLR